MKSSKTAHTKTYKLLIVFILTLAFFSGAFIYKVLAKNNVPMELTATENTISIEQGTQGRFKGLVIGVGNVTSERQAEIWLSIDDVNTMATLFRVKQGQTIKYNGRQIKVIRVTKYKTHKNLPGCALGSVTLLVW